MLRIDSKTLCHSEISNNYAHHASIDTAWFVYPVYSRAI